ncbi:peptidoglycan bridge formation glycyltransferase FemA/FemB family protein [Maribacter sp. CXY002]|uniref:peptidoglycan bridge formation glycyltransferase FemA/FemB family protein n=1 Tax=Maribacter luteocoastalis TaxID=3407671 RepID=UPI003B67083E
MVSIIETKDKWMEIVEDMDNHDFYHTYDYHTISKKEGEQPILFLYTENEYKIAIPFLKRAIAGTPYHDLTSVYGYAGPITKNINQTFNNQKFITNFKNWLEEEGIISVFSRLHPYFDYQNTLLSGIGEQPVLGKVVNIDLTQNLEEQRREYGKSTKNRTNKCRRLCTVKLAETDEEINTFIDIYYENMDRLEANKDYYFSRQYFFDFLKCTDFKTDILLVNHVEDTTTVAASMFVKTGNMVQFHLSGSKTDYLSIAPANLFLDEMRIRATEEGYTYFNLGGGLGSKEDSLFNFKASFSKNHKEFAVWKYIANQTVYDDLSHKTAKTNTDFFPLYRAN